MIRHLDTLWNDPPEKSSIEKGQSAVLGSDVLKIFIAHSNLEMTGFKYEIQWLSVYLGPLSYKKLMQVFVFGCNLLFKEEW